MLAIEIPARRFPSLLPSACPPSMRTRSSSWTTDTFTHHEEPMAAYGEYREIYPVNAASESEVA